jgi:5-methylthioadenosine/S-adenosylhomocysteine deaminase
MNIDTLIEARWVVPIEPAGSVLDEHAIAVQSGRIVAVLPTLEARERFNPKRHVQLGDHALIPGLVNLHTHAAMTLLRGLADDLPLMTWLEQHIWPAEAAHVSPQFVYDGTRLACAEMLRAGVTCFNDMYFFPDAAARSALEAGMRAVLGMIVIEFPSAYASDAADYLHRGLSIRDQFKGEPLLDFVFAPHAPYTVSDRSFQQILTYADELGAAIHIHLHETAAEIKLSLDQHGLRPVQRLANLGLLGPNLIAVHAVHLEPQEMTLLAKLGCHVAHCPSSNLKLASGFARAAALHEAGVNVGIGTDSAASNNRLDMFAELRLAALLAKGVSESARSVPAHQALAMATLCGARALGMESSIGSLAAGKAADIVAIDLGGVENTPCYDVASHLIYAASREHVSHVWVNGELLVENGGLTRIDTAEIQDKAHWWQRKIAETDHKKT